MNPAVKRRFRKDARKCPVHQAIYDVATHLLADRGYFSKEEVLVTSEGDFSYIEEAINWDGLRTWIEDEDGGQNCELMALSNRFFTHRTEEAMANMPVKFLAIGGGKRTAGYGLFGCGNGHLAVRLLQHKNKVCKGVANNLKEDYEEAGRSSGAEGWAANKIDATQVAKVVANLDRKIDKTSVALSEESDRQRQQLYQRELKDKARAERQLFEDRKKLREEKKQEKLELILK